MYTVIITKTAAEQHEQFSDWIKGMLREAHEALRLDPMPNHLDRREYKPSEITKEFQFPDEVRGVHWWYRTVYISYLFSTTQRVVVVTSVRPGPVIL